MCCRESILHAWQPAGPAGGGCRPVLKRRCWWLGHVLHERGGWAEPAAAWGVAQLKVYDGQLVERMRELLSHDLCITINSDDPSYFGGCAAGLLR